MVSYIKFLAVLPISPIPVPPPYEPTRTRSAQEERVYKIHKEAIRQQGNVSKIKTSVIELAHRASKNVYHMPKTIRRQFDPGQKTLSLD